jgi:anaerobic dimethyl sulfoxide reductase subunit C (anchor subunit)
MLVTGVTGMALVYIMSMIYTYIRTQPAWNTPFTMLTFFITALLLGTLGAGVILNANYQNAKKRDAECQETQCSLLRSALQGVSMGALVLLGVELIALPIYLVTLAVDVEGGVLTAQTIVSEFSGVMVARLILAFIGAGILTAIVYRVVAQQGQERLAGNLVYAAFALVLIAETLGRFVFYTSNVRIGL